MRNAFADEITKMAADDDRVVLLPGDIGNRLFDTFKGNYPDRFLNCGVAEQNLISVAAGMASCGMRPFAYSITPFITTRCLEQIRVDVCYHDVPVVIVGTGSGLAYASLGATHHSCEDIGFLRLLPNMTVLCPADPTEARLATRQALSHDGPVYIRLGKKGEPSVHDEPPDFRIGRAIEMRAGRDVCILSTGTVLPMAIEAADILAGDGVGARVVNMHTVKPLDTELLEEVSANYPLIVTVEEHSLIGGFGSAVCEWQADNDARQAHLIRFGTGDFFLHEAGETAYALERYGLTSQAIAKRIKDKVDML